MNKEYKMTDLEKRLIACMDLGIYIYRADGHRWIHCDYDKDYNLNDILKKEGILVNDKIYGGYLEALEVIDKGLVMAKRPTLLESFNNSFDIKYDVEFVRDVDSRVGITDKNKGGFY